MLLAQITNSPAWWQFLSYSKDSFASVESIFKIVAILIAGGWAIFHFSKRREAFPRVDLQHRVEVLDFSETEWLVRLSLSIKNDSTVLMRIFEGHTWIQQIQPWPVEMIEEFKERSKDPKNASPEVLWPLIHEKLHNDERELEPGESDEISMDFFISKIHAKILIYSFINNNAKPGRHLGWSYSNVVDFLKLSGESSAHIPAQTIEKPRPTKAILTRSLIL